MIRNLTRQTLLSQKTCYARGLLMRGRGMIGRRFRDFDAMVFESCSMIHTCFMSIPLDVCFLDRENRILLQKEFLPPWVPALSCRGAATVVELPAGTFGRTGTQEGDFLDLSAELSSEYILGKHTPEKLIQTPETYIPFGEHKE